MSFFAALRIRMPQSIYAGSRGFFAALRMTAKVAPASLTDL